MKKFSLLIILLGVLCLLSCTDAGISRQFNTDKKIFKIQEDFYLRKIMIDGDVLYIRCDEYGNFLSSPIGIEYKKGKSNCSTGIAID